MQKEVWQSSNRMQFLAKTRFVYSCAKAQRTNCYETAYTGSWRFKFFLNRAFSHQNRNRPFPKGHSTHELQIIVYHSLCYENVWDTHMRSLCEVPTDQKLSHCENRLKDTLLAFETDFKYIFSVQAELQTIQYFRLPVHVCIRLWQSNFAISSNKNYVLHVLNTIKRIICWIFRT